jgi:hypothetical protein
VPQGGGGSGANGYSRYAAGGAQGIPVTDAIGKSGDGFRGIKYELGDFAVQ